MACRDVWNTWHEGLQAPQNPTAKPEGFVATGGPRAMYFTHHGKPWLKPIIARPSEWNMVQNCSYFNTNKVNNDGNRRQQSKTEQDWAWLFSRIDSTPNFDFLNNYFVD